MRYRLLNAPVWVQSLFTGAVFGLLMALNGRFLDDESWTEALVTGVLLGVFFGAFMGPIAARMNRRFREAADDLPPDQIFRAGRLARRGAVPEDPELRGAARRIALQQREQLVRQRRWTLPFSGLLVCLAVWRALSGGESAPLWELAAVFFLALMAAQVFMARNLARRAELLADPPQEPR